MHRQGVIEVQAPRLRMISRGRKPVETKNKTEQRWLAAGNRLTNRLSGHAKTISSRASAVARAAQLNR